MRLPRHGPGANQTPPGPTSPEARMSQHRFIHHDALITVGYDPDRATYYADR